jgi:formiminotetrahydrofolate cyclodeaminase
VSVDRPIRAFLADLASEAPTPGGGSAAAVMGAMGAALVSMVCRLTIGRKGYEAVDAELTAVLDEAEILRARLTDMARADVEAYTAVLTAYQRPKDTPEQAVARTDAVQAALRGATEVPIACARASAAVVALARRAAEKGNRAAAGDAAAGACAAHAALRASALNVHANAARMTDRAYATAALGEIEALVTDAALRVEEVWQLLTERS